MELDKDAFVAMIRRLPAEDLWTIVHLAQQEVRVRARALYDRLPEIVRPAPPAGDGGEGGGDGH